MRSKFLTANINPKSRYEPYVFTETGIYMLMTVLNGELATRQSKALIRTFKQMKDYLSHDPLLSDSANIASLSLQISENTREISDNMMNILRLSELQAFQAEYPNVKLSFQRTGGKFHDRCIILDYKARTEKIYHCGASSKDAGNKITTISKSDNKELYHPMVDNLLLQPALRLR